MWDGVDVPTSFLRILRKLRKINLSSPLGQGAFVFQNTGGDRRSEWGVTAQVFREINGPALMNGTGLARWRQCIDYPRLDEDVQNVVFENELASQRGSDVVGKVSIIPTIRINGQQYRGTLTSANVMRALCGAFPMGQEPEVCNMEWVSEDECREGASGWLACRNRCDGTSFVDCRRS